MTGLKIQEEQIQQSERLATAGHMAAGVAHEDQLKKVRDHIQRINKIVRDLVDFSRPSSMQTEKVQGQWPDRISKMNGSIKVKSTYGEGTTFIIQLPINNA